MDRRAWADRAILALILIASSMMIWTIVALKGTVDRADDKVDCLLYELSAHRLANQADHKIAVHHHLFPESTPEESGRPKDLPPHLRKACEAVLPGSTGDP